MPKMRPFLKWAGGKYRILDRILQRLPKGDRLVEPFVGSGAVFLNAAYDRYLLADANADLIQCYTALKTDPARLLAETQQLFTPRGNTRAVFVERRAAFNRLKQVPMAGDELFRKAALFIYLNRHCFNGLCRYNRSGAFNVPFGRYTKPYFPEEEMRAFADKLQQAELLWAGYDACFASLSTGDVVYCDPPYVPLSATANFTEYAEGGFSLTDQETLNRLSQKASANGIPVVISNHETAFTRALYRQAKRHRFAVRRFISCKGDQRERASELLAVYR